MFYQYLKRFVEHPHALWILTAILILFYLPYLSIGLILDDLYHYSLVNDPRFAFLSDHKLSIGFFNFITADAQRTKSLIELALIPWWTADNFRFVFFRPLTELSLFIDYSLFRDYPALMHLHSVVLKLISCPVVFYCTLQISKNRFIAILTTIIFGLDSTHSISIGWLANRSALLACFFGLLALLYFMRAVEHKTSGKPLLISTLFLILAYAGGEIAISFVGLMFCFSLFTAQQTLRRKVILLCVPGTLTLVYLVFYKMMGFGAAGDAYLYTNPLDPGSGFIMHALMRIPALLAGTISPFASDYFSISVTLTPGVFIAVAVVTLIVLPFYKEIVHDKLLLASLLGLLLCAVPVAAKLPSDRNLYVATYPACLFVALILQRAINKEWLNQGIKRRFAQLIAGLLFFSHIVVSALLTPASAFALEELSARGLSAYDDLTIDFKGKTVLFINTPFTLAGLATPSLNYLGLALPDEAIWISGYHQHTRVSKAQDGSIIVEIPEGLGSNLGEQLFRAAKLSPFTLKKDYSFGNIDIEILEFTQDQLPSKLKIKQRKDVAFLYLTTRDNKIVPLDF